MLSTTSNWLAAAGFLGLCGLAALELLWQLCRSRRLELEVRLRDESLIQTQVAQESLDTMIQRAQGVILVFQGFAGELHKTDAMRQRMELALDQADTWLSEARECADVRSLIEPHDDVAFALSRACRRLFAGSSVRFSTLSTGAHQVLVPEVAEGLYQIGLEALTNVLHHASASRVEVEVAYEGGRFRLCVRDDGCGFTALSLPRSRSTRLLGLQGMRDTARRMGGQLRVWSRRVSGTEIEVVVPAQTAYRHARFVPQWIQTAIFRCTLC